MAHLTVKEKEHWKERISRKVDQAIDKLLAMHDSSYLERIANEAKQLALESLGIRELKAKATELKRQVQVAELEQDRLHRTMVAQITGRRFEDVTTSSYGSLQEIQQAVVKRKLVHEDELLAKDELGRRILALRREKEELLDTVWLATSGNPIRQLWSAVTGLLEQPDTQLQAEALAINPEPEAA